MNAAEMVYHSQYHQRVLARKATCPTCGANVPYGEGYFMPCEKGHKVALPVWKDVDEMPECPYKELHE